jgi:perosamine synthetase
VSDPTRRRLVVEGGTPALDVDIKRFKPIPEAGISDAVEAMRTGATFRYGVGGPENSHVSRFEREFAAYLGVGHAVALNSCGASMFVALRIAGVRPGDRVLLNAFTFTAVPSAIHQACGVPLLVESNRDFAIDTDDLERKAQQGDSRVLLLSYMRGHVPRMDEVVRICKTYDLTLIEDCAHALCTSWNGTPMGRFGQIACFSTQSSKALSSGEGGILCSDDPEIAAKAILFGGSYEKGWTHHFDVPEECSRLQSEVPCYSMRMSEVVAAMLRPQIARLEEIRSIHRANYMRLVRTLETSSHIEIPPVDPRVEMLGDTLQFHLSGLTEEQAGRFIELGKLENIPMQIFGAERNARDFRWWKYLPAPPPLPVTEDTIRFAVDLCLGSHLTVADIDAIGDALLRILDWIVEETPVRDGAGSGARAPGSPTSLT